MNKGKISSQSTLSHADLLKLGFIIRRSKLTNPQFAGNQQQFKLECDKMVFITYIELCLILNQISLDICQI
jgi:hypothetical protein